MSVCAGQDVYYGCVFAAECKAKSASGKGCWHHMGRLPAQWDNHAERHPYTEMRSLQVSSAGGLLFSHQSLRVYSYKRTFCACW